MDVLKNIAACVRHARSGGALTGPKMAFFGVFETKLDTRLETKLEIENAPERPRFTKFAVQIQCENGRRDTPETT